MCGNMFVQFVLLFFTALNYAAGYGGRYPHKPHGFSHQAQHWPSEYSSEKPQLNTAFFGVGGLQHLPVSHWAIQQSKDKTTSPPASFPSPTSEKTIHSTTYYESSDSSPAGGELTYFGEFPYMAAIGYNRKGGGFDYQCGGVLVSPFYVLTAAHCRSVKGQSPAVTRIGGDRLDDNWPENQPIEITDIIVHPNYNRRQVYNDIALLRLKDASSRDPAFLLSRDETNYNTATAIGYGQTAFGSSTSTDLLKVELQLYSSQVCQQYYTPRFRIERGLIGTQLCAGDFNRVKDTCPGDSGGPLLASTTVNNTWIHFVLGITSFGLGCAEGIPGVYTRVSPYLAWIEPIVWSTK